jgi:phosphatidylserine/phosphatidylglycerophosphate/cardiolipin synthase-like enzyme
VETTLVLPTRNYSPLVAAACRSAYPDLLRSGVRLFEYPLGLLHTKSVTVDARITLVGSANMDRRSLELNFENNLLMLDPGVTAMIRDRQLGYLSQSTIVKAESAEDRPFHVRLVDNVIAMASPCSDQPWSGQEALKCRDDELVVFGLREPGHRDHADRPGAPDDERERPAVGGEPAGVQA